MMEYGIALTAGTFDPVTKGHLDIIRRAADMCAVLIVGIFENPDKKPLFSLEKRFEALCAATMDIDNAIVITNDGMLVTKMTSRMSRSRRISILNTAG